MQRLNYREKGNGLLILVVLIFIAGVVSQFIQVAAIERAEARFNQQLRVVQGIDSIFDAYSSYFVTMCHLNDTSIPATTLPQLRTDGWLLLEPFNPANATIALSLSRPTTTLSSVATGNRTLNNSSSILHVLVTYPSTNIDDFSLLIDALNEKKFEHTVDYSNLSVDIQEQVINRRSSSELLNESVFRDRTCI
ncbi:hypothetical protein [Vibrio harveyi]|uniref:hypothetical protein n=1 Tax=Vibrio harveyi TaxID=669 RepID=UPI003BB5273A|nr:hypothetical protein [Vibrio harveyi]